MTALGFRLQLLLGPTVPVPAPLPVIDALEEVAVTSNDRERDGFQLTFGIEKKPLVDYALLNLGALKPGFRVIVAVFVGPRRELLIDGMITDVQTRPAGPGGRALLVVTGEDISLKMDLEHKRVTHPQQADWQIVTKIVLSYALVPKVIPTSDTPLPTGRLPSQDGTDLGYVRELAWLNGFVFYVEPAETIGVASAYWGPPDRLSPPQPPLSLDMGPDSTVESLTFQHNALAPVEPLVRFIETQTRQTLPIPKRDELFRLLSAQPARPMRKTIARGTAKLSGPRAATRMDAELSRNAEAIDASGELDAVRYGRVLRPRRLVFVRGAGLSHNGVYYVKRVAHTIRRGSYRQRFDLTREGLESLIKRLPL